MQYDIGHNNLVRELKDIGCILEDEFETNVLDQDLCFLTTEKDGLSAITGSVATPQS